MDRKEQRLPACCNFSSAPITFNVSEINSREAVRSFEWFDLFPPVNWPDGAGWCLKDGWAVPLSWLTRFYLLHIGTQRVMRVTRWGESWEGEKGIYPGCWLVLWEDIFTDWIHFQNLNCGLRVNFQFDPFYLLPSWLSKITSCIWPVPLWLRFIRW